MIALQFADIELDERLGTPIASADDPQPFAQLSVPVRPGPCVGHSFVEASSILLANTPLRRKVATLRLIFAVDPQSERINRIMLVVRPAVGVPEADGDNELDLIAAVNHPTTGLPVGIFEVVRKALPS